MSIGRSPSTPAPSSPTASGLARLRVVGPDQGAVHTELAVGAMAPGGWLAPHVHSFEEALYVLEGELLLDLGGRVHRLAGRRLRAHPDRDCATRWATAAASRSGSSRSTPRSGWIRRPAARDTFFEPAQDLVRMDAEAVRPPFGDPTLRLVGHYEGTPPQLEALRIADRPRDRAPAGMDTALLAYSGISVKMLVDRTFGADLVTMFTVDYEVGGAAQAHDHPFEEAYVFLAGEIEAELDGQRYTLRAGDVVFAGVGSVHGFWNDGSERVRWIETQAPQPPARQAYRWVRSWERYEQNRQPGGVVMSNGGAVVVVGGTRAIGKEIVRHYAGRGETVVLTGQDPAHVEAAVAEIGAGATGVAFDLAEPTSIAAALAGVGPVRRLVLVAIDRDQNTVAEYDIARAIRLVTLKLVGYTEVVHALRSRLTDGCLDRAVRRHGQGTAVSGLDDGHDRQRRHRRPDPDARRGAQAAARELDPSRASSVTARTGPRSPPRSPATRPRRPSAGWRRWTRSSTPRSSSSRTAP